MRKYSNNIPGLQQQEAQNNGIKLKIQNGNRMVQYVKPLKSRTFISITRNSPGDEIAKRDLIQAAICQIRLFDHPLPI